MPFPFRLDIVVLTLVLAMRRTNSVLLRKLFPAPGCDVALCLEI